MPGYGDPPKPSRFQKGYSGNPSGGRKRPVTLSSLLTEPVEITENGKNKTVEPYYAYLIVQVQKALKGDMAAIRLVLKVMKKYDALPLEKTTRTSGVLTVRGFLPMDLRWQLSERRNGSVLPLEEMDNIRRAYFSAAEEIEKVREEYGVYTSNAEFQALLIAGKDTSLNG